MIIWTLFLVQTFEDTYILEDTIRFNFYIKACIEMSLITFNVIDASSSVDLISLFDLNLSESIFPCRIISSKMSLSFLSLDVGNASSASSLSSSSSMSTSSTLERELLKNQDRYRLLGRRLYSDRYIGR